MGKRDKTLSSIRRAFHSSARQSTMHFFFILFTERLSLERRWKFHFLCCGRDFNYITKSFNLQHIENRSLSLSLLTIKMSTVIFRKKKYPQSVISVEFYITNSNKLPRFHPSCMSRNSHNNIPSDTSLPSA